MTPAGVSHTQLADVPLAADQMGFEELNGLLYYVAGRTELNHSQKVYAYNPADNTWTELADYPIACQSLILRAVGTKLYGIGGHNSQTHNFYGNVYEYDPDTNVWTAKTSMPTPREDFGSAVIGTKIYCFGGLTNSPADYTPTKKLEIYDTSNDTWDTTKADMLDYKHFGDFGAVVNGKIYAVGGSNTFMDYPIIHPVSSVYEYDPIGNVWTAKAALPFTQSYKECAVLDGLVYVVSGATVSTTDYTNMVFAFNPTTNNWERKGDAPYVARGAGLAAVGGKIYMVGGFNGAMLDSLYELGYA